MKSIIFCLNLALILIPNAIVFATTKSIAFETDSVMVQKNENLDTNIRQNRRQFRFGASFDVGPAFHTFSSRPFLLSSIDPNFIGFDSEIKFNALSCSISSLFIDYVEGDNILRGGLGFKLGYGLYEWREATKLFITNMAGNQVEVNLPIKRELYYNSSSFVISAGFKRKLFGALYGEIAGEASFALDRNFQYREYVSSSSPEYDGFLPGFQGHFNAIAGISYDIPYQISKETTYNFALFIRYYYALTSMHTMANWKINRIGFGVEIRL
jgi:hypothetical protein